MKKVDIELLGLAIERNLEIRLAIIGLDFFLEGKRFGANIKGPLVGLDEIITPHIHAQLAQIYPKRMFESIKWGLGKKGMVMSNESHILDEITRAMLLINGNFLRYDFRTQEVEIFQGTRIETKKM